MGQALFPGEEEDNGAIGYFIGVIIVALFMVPKLGWLWGIITSIIWPLTLIFYIVKLLI